MNILKPNAKVTNVLSPLSISATDHLSSLDQAPVWQKINKTSKHEHRKSYRHHHLSLDEKDTNIETMSKKNKPQQQQVTKGNQKSPILYQKFTDCAMKKSPEASYTETSRYFMRGLDEVDFGLEDLPDIVATIRLLEDKAHRLFQHEYNDKRSAIIDATNHSFEQDHIELEPSNS